MLEKLVKKLPDYQAGDEVVRVLLVNTLLLMVSDKVAERCFGNVLIPLFLTENAGRGVFSRP